MRYTKPLAAGFTAMCLAALAGCGKGKDSTTGMDPETELNEEQKQQVDDLNRQRQEEWKTTPKK